MRKLAVLLTIVLVIFIVGCSKEEKKEVQEKSNDGVTNESTETTDPTIYPFTGIETDEDVTNRAVAVMVSNQVQARPQSGLTKADIVFEMLTEGNITRFMAIYQSTEPDVVGPVRSAREYFFTLADNYDAIYVYQGAADFINEMITSQEIEHLQGATYDNDGHLFIREAFRKTPHNSYLQFGAVYDVAAEEGYETSFTYEPLSFLDENSEIDGEDANYVKIDYYGGKPIVEFEYDETTQKYTRYNDQEKSVELESEIPIQVDNVFIVETEHEVIDKELRRAIDIDSGGTAYLLQRGKVQHIEWENRDGRITPVKDGQVVPFVPGQTWINFVQSVPESGVKEQVQIENNEM